MAGILSCMLSVSGLTLTDFEKRLLAQVQPMGVTLFARNVKDRAQVAALTQSIKEVIGRADVLVAVDQEGGRVCRFTPPQFRPYVSQCALASLSAAESAEITHLHGVLIADDLRSMGINWVYAPCLDVAFPDTTKALRSRCFSVDEKIVANLGTSLVNTYIENGIAPCIKHAPGHGRATTDPHLGLPVLPHTLKELEKDFYPFVAVSPLSPAMMTAHVVISAVDDKPVTQSQKAILEIIRGRFGFDGLLITDAIDMHALKGTAGEKTKASLDAGCDAVCYCFAKEDELSDVATNCQPLSDKGLERFNKLIAVTQTPPPVVDIQEAAARYAALAARTKTPAVDYDTVETLHKMQKDE